MSEATTLQKEYLTVILTIVAQQSSLMNELAIQVEAMEITLRKHLPQIQSDLTANNAKQREIFRLKHEEMNQLLETLQAAIHGLPN
jgi:hypothetical protein